MKYLCFSLSDLQLNDNHEVIIIISLKKTRETSGKKFSIKIGQI